MSASIDHKTLRHAIGSAITLARLIRNCLRDIYEEAMVLYLKHSHNNLAANTFRGGPVYGCDMTFALVISAQKAAKATRAGPGGRPPPNRLGAPLGHGNRFARLNVPGRPNGANLGGAHNAFM
jgi:hypothetical protein